MNAAWHHRQVTDMEEAMHQVLISVARAEGRRSASISPLWSVPTILLQTSTLGFVVQLGKHCRDENREPWGERIDISDMIKASSPV